MIKREFDFNGSTYERISKKAAEKAYNSGKTVIFCPCNLHPFGFFHPGSHLNINDGNGDFKRLVNHFTYYNCINTETGKYISFYQEVKTYVKK